MFYSIITLFTQPNLDHFNRFCFVCLLCIVNFFIITFVVLNYA